LLKKNFQIDFQHILVHTANKFCVC